MCNSIDDLQKKMDLPPDKARVLRNYDLPKKWELVCDQVGSSSSRLSMRMTRALMTIAFR